MASKCQPVQSRFRKMIIALSENFTQGNCEKINYLNFLSPVGGRSSHPSGDTSIVALHVLSSLEASGDISPWNVDRLESILQEISRCDLLWIITEYKKSKEYCDAQKEKKRKEKKRDPRKSGSSEVRKTSKQKKKLRTLYALLNTHITGMSQVMDFIGEELDRIGEDDDDSKLTEKFVKVAEDGGRFMDNLHGVFRDIGIRPNRDSMSSNNRDSTSSEETPANTPIGKKEKKLP